MEINTVIGTMLLNFLGGTHRSHRNKKTGCGRSPFSGEALVIVLQEPCVGLSFL